MVFSQQGNFYKVSRVTGPAHNFLSVTMASDLSKAEPQIEALPGLCDGHGELDAAAIVQSVLEGLEEANLKFVTKHAVEYIQYRMGDNPPEVVYGVLMFKIVERLVSGTAFM